MCGTNTSLHKGRLDICARKVLISIKNLPAIFFVDVLQLY